MRTDAEVIIVGAGAAGIACAQKLSEKNVDFLLLEAQDRIGGRVRSLEVPGDPTPIELGAEFIHGAPKEILGWIHRLHFPFYDVQDTHLFGRGKRLENLPDFWEKMEKIMSRLNTRSKTDRSVEEFLEKLPKLPAEQKSLFRGLVEGFHAADLRLIGEKGLADADEIDDENLNGSQSFRALRPYESLLRGILQSANCEQRTLLRTALRKIEWSPGGVKLQCTQEPDMRNVTFSCRKLVLTIPLGVLKSPSIEWNPLPHELLRCLEGVQMGHVQRMTFRFRERFWEKLTDRPLSFVHVSAQKYFPTWWTLQPLRVPHLVAWQGGPMALELSQMEPAKRAALALRSLTAWSGLSRTKLDSLLLSWHTHDWSRDPHSLGAYSYVGRDGLAAARRFSRPLAKTLFFAGEATQGGPSRGTVSGAFDSGLRAAKQISDSL